jgi:hypothetical protein
MRPYILLIAALSVTFSVNSQLAFPGATGFGKNTRGAYAKYAATGNSSDLPLVYYVDNLNDSGSGSLRTALTATVPRIVIFRTGGMINLSSFISITSPYITIAGYTAPGGGICVKGGTIWVRASEVIIRNIRVRNGVWAAPDLGTDCINISANGTLINNVIIDHCSVSWFSDGGIDLNGSNGGVQNVSIQNNIIAEGFAGHSLLSNVGSNCTNISYFKNYFTNAEGRMPRWGAGVIGTAINNLSYNWQTDGFRVSENTFGDVLYNKFKYGNLTSASGKNKAIRLSSDGNLKPKVYLEGNESNGILINEATAGASTDLSTLPYFNNSIYGVIPIQNLSIVESEVLDGAGASPKDAVDTRLTQGYHTNTGSIPDQSTVLDYPALVAGSYPPNNTGVHLLWLVGKGYAANTTLAEAIPASFLLIPENGKTGVSIIEEFINDTTIYTTFYLSTYYRDADGDGYGTVNDQINNATAPAGYVSISGDCDDTNPAIFPGSTEICENNIDDNCNGEADENCPLGLPVINISDVVVYESDGQAHLEISLSRPVASDISISFTTANKTAVSPQDYKAIKGIVIIPAGSVKQVIRVPVVLDNIIEPKEYFKVSISSKSTLCKVNKGVATATLYDGKSPASSSALARQLKIETFEPFHFKVNAYPNPSADYFTVNFAGTNDEAVTFTLSDITGKILENRVIDYPGNTIKVGHQLHKGVYFLKMYTNSNLKLIKLVKL